MYKLLGLAFIALLGAALSLSVLTYRKAFTPASFVTLRADHTGLQVLPGADVKLRGVVVGEVRRVSADGQAATLRLALDPASLPQIPADVTARLLPKTLFGERYVSLEAPAGGSAAPLRPGAVIGQDRTTSAVELERVLDDALPLLQAVQPDKLAATLSALAGALDGQGEKLGGDLVALDHYVGALNTQLPAIKTDLTKLSSVLSTYDGALPDLLSILRNLTVTATTVSDQRGELAAFLADATDVADSSRAFLQRYGDRLIQLGNVTAPVLQLLATYAPEYPCLLRALVDQLPNAAQVFAGGEMHITLEVTRDNGRYLPGHDEPAYEAHSGPDCHGLPHPPVPAPQVNTPNGYDYGASRPPVDPLPLTAAPLTVAPMGYAGTPEEQALVKPLVGAATGTDPAKVPDLADLLWGPLLRGAVVNVP